MFLETHALHATLKIPYIFLWHFLYLSPICGHCLYNINLTGVKLGHEHMGQKDEDGYDAE